MKSCVECKLNKKSLLYVFMILFPSQQDPSQVAQNGKLQQVHAEAGTQSYKNPAFEEGDPEVDPEANPEENPAENLQSMAMTFV